MLCHDGGNPLSSLTFSPGVDAEWRKCLEMQGLRPRATQPYSTYGEEPDGSETQLIQAFPTLSATVGEKVRLSSPPGRQHLGGKSLPATVLG